jgi:hypothetical protein
MGGRENPGEGSQKTVAAVMSQVWRVMDSAAWTGTAGRAQAIPVIARGLFTGPATCDSDQRRIRPAAATGHGGCSTLPMTRVLVPVAARSRLPRGWWRGVAGLHPAAGARGSGARWAGSEADHLPGGHAVRGRRPAGRGVSGG